MKLKNTYKSKIFEKKLARNLFYASIYNSTLQTDTISKNIDKRFVQFYFCTQGKATFHFTNEYKKVLEEGNSFLIYTPDSETQLQLSISSKSKINLLVMDINELHHWFDTDFFEDFLWNHSENIHEENRLFPEIYPLLNTIENAPIATSLQDLFIEIKIKELLLLFFSHRNVKESSCPFLNNEELASKIKQAKDIILQNLKTPPNSKQLAQKVALSEYKLKQGFKEIYGKSLGQYIIYQRIIHGKELLEKTDFKVLKIAQEVGYENPSHFIDAFKKHFAVTPKTYKKNTKLTS